jgi:hypothetical protein
VRQARGVSVPERDGFFATAAMLFFRYLKGWMSRRLAHFSRQSSFQNVPAFDWLQRTFHGSLDPGREATPTPAAAAIRTTPKQPWLPSPASKPSQSSPLPI